MRETAIISIVAHGQVCVREILRGTHRHARRERWRWRRRALQRLIPGQKGAGLGDTARELIHCGFARLVPTKYSILVAPCREACIEKLGVLERKGDRLGAHGAHAALGVKGRLARRKAAE